MAKGLAQRTHDAFFRLVHGNALIYNTCWEDPRLDRELLGLGPGSRLVTITSAGCNALDYLLDSPAEIHAVDVNPRQNALLELKMALLRLGDHSELFRVFGEGVRAGGRGERSLHEPCSVPAADCGRVNMQYRYREELPG